MENIALIVAVVAVLFFIINQSSGSEKSKLLLKNFKSLGDMKGKSLEEITSIVGPYTIKEALSDGTAYTWDSPKFAIRIAFDLNNKCTRVLGEVSK